MKKVYVMHRTGTFKPKKPTANQCKEPFHSSYHYRLDMVFDGEMTLNAQMFIIDHAAVDKMVQTVQPNGSCEQMHKQINAKIRKLMSDSAVDMLACRCAITPVLPLGAAWLDFVSVKSDEYLPYLALLKGAY